MLLAKLRAPGEKGYKIPRGFLFDYVTCANYTAEIWGWILYSVGVQALPAAIFMVAGAYQMVLWALAKHSRLHKVGLPGVQGLGLGLPPGFYGLGFWGTAPSGAHRRLGHSDAWAARCTEPAARRLFLVGHMPRPRLHSAWPGSTQMAKPTLPCAVLHADLRRQGGAGKVPQEMGHPAAFHLSSESLLRADPSLVVVSGDGRPEDTCRETWIVLPCGVVAWKWTMLDLAIQWHAHHSRPRPSLSPVERRCTFKM